VTGAAADGLPPHPATLRWEAKDEENTMLSLKSDRVRKEEARLSATPNGRRTRIDDISEIGEHLSEEHLRWVIGGAQCQANGTSSGSQTTKNGADVLCGADA
jgi:hypothetical protein